jgi:hypothetical protein
MDAVVLYVEGDEALASAVAAKLSPASVSFQCFDIARAFRFPRDTLLVCAWSSLAAQRCMGVRFGSTVLAHASRCIVVRGDRAPLPSLPGVPFFNATLETLEEAVDSYMFSDARAKAKKSPFRASSLAPGFGLGLAIYAGMFVAVSSTQSAQVHDAIEAGKVSAPIASTLKTIEAAGPASLMNIRVVDVAAAATPAAKFVEMRTVTVTPTVESQNIEIRGLFDPADDVLMAQIDDRPLVSVDAFDRDAQLRLTLN